MKLRTFISVLLIIVPAHQIAQSQNINSIGATPSVISEQGASLLITEVNFKNSDFDWVKMLYISPSEKAINLNGVSFQDDSKFKTIEEDIYIASGQELLLSFKNDLPDQIPYLYSGRSGLTGTTEQFVIYDNLNNILDAVCWTSSNPTKSEIKDMSDVFELEGWISPDPASCIFSENIAKNESIIRFNLNDTNSPADWKSESELKKPQEVTPPNEVLTNDDNDSALTPPQVVKINDTLLSSNEQTESEDSKNENLKTIIPDNVELITLDTNHLQKTDDSDESENKKTSNKTNAVSYSNGDLSDSIIISEILPNPEGTDTKKEWIELCNQDDQIIKLGNWTLDDIEDGSKPYKIPSDISLKENTCIVFKSQDTKLSLGNGEDEVHLFDYLGTEIDSVNYEGAPSGESYTRIRINKEDGSTDTKWIWNKDQSPGQPNLEYYELTLKISEAPVFDQTYYFKATDQKSNNYIVEFSEELISAPMAQATFTKNTIIKTLYIPVEEYDNHVILKQYEVTETGEETSGIPLILPAIIFTFIVVSATAFYLLKNKIPWQDIKENHNRQNE